MNIFEINLIVAGTFWNGAHRDFLVVKIGAAGNLLWRQIYNDEANATPTVLSADVEGNIYVAGTVNESGGSHLRMLRYSPTGGLYWGQIYRGGRTNYARGILVDSAGNALAMVETSTSDGVQNVSQTRQVMFATNGQVYLR